MAKIEDNDLFENLQFNMVEVDLEQQQDLNEYRRQRINSSNSKLLKKKTRVDLMNKSSPYKHIDRLKDGIIKSQRTQKLNTQRNRPMRSYTAEEAIVIIQKSLRMFYWKKVVREIKQRKLDLQNEQFNHVQMQKDMKVKMKEEKTGKQDKKKDKKSKKDKDGKKKKKDKKNKKAGSQENL